MFTFIRDVRSMTESCTQSSKFVTFGTQLKEQKYHVLWTIDEQV